MTINTRIEEFVELMVKLQYCYQQGMFIIGTQTLFLSQTGFLKILAQIVIGHELFINKLSIETQLGYYVYKPFDYETDIYQRVGVKYYIYKNIFTGVGLKAHGGRAEAGEFSIGIRL